MEPVVCAWKLELLSASVAHLNTVKIIDGRDIHEPLE